MDLLILWDALPRPVKQWVAFIWGVIAIVAFPTIGYFSGLACEEWNIDGLSQSPGITREMARQETWDWSQIWFITGLIIGLIFLIIGLVYLLTPEKKHSAWE